MTPDLLIQPEFTSTAASALIALSCGVVTGAILSIAALRLRAGPLLTENYSGRRIPVVGGFVLVLSVVMWSAAAFLAPEGLMGMRAGAEHLVPVAVLVGFFLLGLLDDMAGGRDSKGFRGHARALLRGRVTTGAVKAAGGGVLAILLSLTFENGSWLWVIVRALVIVLFANLLNLLDLRPGRALKVYLLGALAVGLVLWMRSTVPPGLLYQATACLTGAALVWLFPDLRELGMLGDAGSNMLGAALGTALVLVLSRPGQAVAAVILLGLNLVSEKWSFSKLIEQVPPLRWFDRLGRKREETSSTVR